MRTYQTTSALWNKKLLMQLACSSAYAFLQEDEMLKQLQFFSVASDGRVTLWTLAKSELLHQVRPCFVASVMICLVNKTSHISLHLLSVAMLITVNLKDT